MTATGKARGVDTTVVRAHLMTLTDRGMTRELIAEQSGVSDRTIRSILSGKATSAYRGTVTALMAVQQAKELTKALVDATATRERLTILHGRRWSTEQIASMAGLSPRTLAPSNLTRTVTHTTQERVKAVYDFLAPAPGPRRTLARALEDIPYRQVAAGTGLSRSTIERAKKGRGVTPAHVRQLVDWAADRTMKEAA